MSTVSRFSYHFRTVAFDLDTTCCGSRKELSDSDISFIWRLQDRGVVVVMTTNRCISDIKDYILRLHPQDPIPIITSGGSSGLLCHASLSGANSNDVIGQVVFQECIEEETVRTVIKSASRLGYMALYYVSSGSVYANPKLSSHFQYAATAGKILDKEIIFVGDDFAALLQQKGSVPFKVQIIGIQHSEKFLSKLGENVCHVEGHDRRLGGSFVQIMNPKARKGRALAKLFRKLGLPSENCVATGYEGDDVDSLLDAGFKIASKEYFSKGKLPCHIASLNQFKQKGAVWDLRHLDRQGILWSK